MASLQIVRDDPEPEPTLPDIPVMIAPGKNLRGLVTFHGFDQEPVGLGKDGNPVKLGLKRIGLADLFTQNSNRDSHVCVYTIEKDGVPLDRIPRLRKDSLDQVRATGFDVVCRSVWIDLDLKDLVGRPGVKDPPKLLWYELTEDEGRIVWEKIEKARATLKAAGMPWNALYTTRGGFRFVHALAVAVPAGAGFEGLVARFLAIYTNAGLPVDQACKDWTRLFRAPRVTLENGMTTWDQEDWFKTEVQGEEDDLYMPTAADLVPALVAPDVEIERTAGRETPEPLTAQALVEFYDEKTRRVRPTDAGKAARRTFKDSAVYPWVFEKAPLAFPGKRHEMLTRAVGEVVATLHGSPGVSPEFIFGLLYEPTGRLGEDEDWTGKLWEMTTSFWDKESQKKAQTAAQAAQDEAEAENPKPQNTERPNVLVGIDDNETFEHLLGRMVAQNTVRPQFFATLDGKLAQVREDRIEELTGLALAAFLARRFRFYMWKADAKGERTECTVNPPKGLAAIVQGSSDFKLHLPIVETVSTVPVLNLETGESFADGYDSNSRTFVVTNPGLRYEPHDDGPAAVQFLAGELLCDFPFASDADRTNALAWLLTCATATSWGSNPTPIFLFDAPGVSNGKTLLGSVGAVLAGVDQAVTAVSGGGEELDKVVAAVMRAGRPVMLLDNLDTKKGRIESKTLAAIATAVGGTTDFRILGQTATVKVRSNNAKGITGNNLAFNADINRRTVRTRIDAKDPHPDRRQGFRHDRLHDWAREHRGELIAAAHTVVRGWIRAGRPAYDGVPTMGSFESWAFTIGNALAHAGVSGFLANRDEQSTDDDTETLRAVLAALAVRFPDRVFESKAALAIVQPLVGAEDAKDARGLGMWLDSVKDRRVLLDGGSVARIERAGRNWRVAIG